MYFSLQLSKIENFRLSALDRTMMASKMEISLHNSEADTGGSILLRRDLIMSFLYLALNARMMPWSKGCETDVVLAGRNLS